MKIDPQFVEALVHDEVVSGGQRFWRRRVLGRRLRPFSVWHELLLGAIESPFVTGEKVMPADLRRAVEVCTSVFPRANVGGASRFSVRAFWACLGRGFAREVEAFERYRADYRAFPEYHVVDDPLPVGEMPTRPSAPLGPPPTTLKVVADVVGWTKWDEERVWNLGSGLARWYQAMALRAQRVRVSFVSPDVGAMQEELEQVDPELHAALVRAAEEWRAGG